jgi:hypothetical protein
MTKPTPSQKGLFNKIFPLDEHYMEQLYGEEHVVGTLVSYSDAKTQCLIYNYVEFASTLMGIKTSELRILDRDAIPFDINVRIPIQGKYGLNLEQDQNIQMDKCSSGVFLLQLKDGTKFVRVRFLSDSFFLYKKNDLLKILRQIKLAASNRAVKPILEEGLLDKIIDETVGFYKDRGKLEEYGIKARKGVLLTGQPGLGKTLCLKYIKQLCRKKNIKYHTVTTSELESAFGKNELEDIFENEGVTVLDDIDISLLSRKTDGKRACAILAAMDGPETSNHCVRIFTTNENVDNLDEAFRRPGRLDCVFEFKAPSDKLRREFIDTWHPDILAQINAQDLVDETENYTFAELQGIKVEIASRIIRKQTINLQDLLNLKLDITDATTSKSKKKVGFE